MYISVCTAVALPHFPYINSDQNHLVKAQRKEEYDKTDKGRDGKTTSENQWAGLEFGKFPEGGGEEGKLEKTGCKLISGAPMNLVVQGLMMMMMMMMTMMIDLHVLFGRVEARSQMVGDVVVETAQEGVRANRTAHVTGTPQTKTTIVSN